jgi:hypothetical protein
MALPFMYRQERISFMSKHDLLKILQTLLKTDAPFNFLLELKKEDLEKLVVAVRDRVEGCNKD